MNFDTEHNFTLESQRVLLRPLEENDFVHLRHFAEQEPELWTYSLVSGAGEDRLKSYISKALEDRQLGNSYPYIVWDKKKKRFAGSTRFYDIQRTHNTVQLGFTWYGKSFQGTGLNKHCKYLLLEFAFDTMGLDRVEFRADFENKKSIFAMKSIGCVEEGVLRSNCAADEGGRRDSIVLSILKNEWNREVKDHLKQKING